MDTKEIIEDLKKIYEECQVYFDIQKKGIVIKHERTKEQREKEPQKEAEFREIRIKLQQLRSRGRTDLPEPPPVNIEEIYGDSMYTLNKKYFEWVITKLDEWEIKENKKVENINSLIKFLEWSVVEREKVEREIEEIHKQEVEKMLVELINSEIEEKQKKADEFRKSIHKDFTEKSQKEWERKGFSYNECKEWIGVGLQPQDSGYATWLRDLFELSPLSYLEYLFTSSLDGNDKFMREQYQQSLQTNEEEDEETLLSRALALSLESNEENEEIKNILLIGRTGSGKSALGNVLVNKYSEDKEKNNNFKGVFEENAKSTSVTKKIQTEKFTLNISEDGREKVNYLVIDTIGFGDTQLETKEILQLLKELVPIIKKNGLNQILFVTDGRFTQEEVDTYKILKSVLFDKNAVNYTTIVRTRFPEFENREVYKEDEKELKEENREIFEILKNSKIIYVDNPPIVGRSKESAREIREESRKRLLTYLGTCQGNYRPVDLENLSQRIDNYLTHEEELKRETTLKEKRIQEEEEKHQKEVEILKKEKDRDLRITVRNFERQTEELRSKNQKKLQATRQEFEAVHQSQLQSSQQAYNEAVQEINQTIRNNLNQIRNNCNQVEVGEPVCSRGHDRNIQTYDKSGVFIPDDQTGFIGHVYCPTCGRNDYDYTLRNATTYTLEEWSRRNAQQAAERMRRMEEAIREQERRQQEIISRINQERVKRDTQAEQDLRERERLEQQVLDQEQRIHEERLRDDRWNSEGQINFASQIREKELRKDLERKKQALEDHERQSRRKRDAVQQELYAYIEQKLP